MIPTIIRSILKNQPIPIYGNGENIRDWIFVKDNVEGILSVITKGLPGETYNLGGDNELSNNELVEAIINFFPDFKTNVSYIEDRKGHDFRYSLDSSRAQRELGFKPDTPFNTALSETIAFYIQNL